MGALVRKIGDNTFRVCVDALADDGFVLHLEQSGGNQGKVIKTAASNLKVYGIAATSTKTNGTGTTTDTLGAANTEVAIIRNGEVSVQLSATNAAITEGDLLIAITGGFVDLYVDDAVFADLAAVKTYVDEIGQIVGMAEEAKGATVGGKIRCNLQLKGSTSAEN
jgi:hypothetical protein